MKTAYLAQDAFQALAHLTEECGEVIQAAGKTFRFGPSSSNPELVEADRETNIAWVIREVADLKKAIAVFDEHMVKSAFGKVW